MFDNRARDGSVTADCAVSKQPRRVSSTSLANYGDEPTENSHV